MTDELALYGDFLKKTIRELGLSAAGVSRALGHKSKTSLHRILCGKASRSSATQTHQAFMDLYGKQLSDEQKARLDALICLNERDAEYYQIRDIFNDMLFYPASREGICSLLEQRETDHALRQLLADLEKAKACRFLVLNCWSNHLVFSYIDSVLHGNPELAYTIRHYTSMPPEKTFAAKSIMEMLPLLFRQQYKNIVLPCPQIMTEAAALSPMLNVDMLLLAYQDAKGETHERQMLWFNKKRGLLIEVGAGTLERVEALLSDGQQYAAPTGNASADASFDNFLRIIDSYREAEEDREIYALCYDLCILFIDADIQRAAFLDGVTELNMGDNPEARDAIEKMYDIENKRFQNVFAKRKVTHLVITEQGFRQFVRTGRMDNDVSLMRPFTVSERIAILERLCKETSQNPFFTVYFIKASEPTEMHMSLNYYADCGMAFVRRGEPYSPEGTDVEGFIHKITFGDFFRRYMRDEFINNGDRMIRNSAHFITQQIDLLKQIQKRDSKASQQKAAAGGSILNV